MQKIPCYIPKYPHYFIRTLSSRQSILLIMLMFWQISLAKFILISMDENQSNHLKAYGIVYKSLQEHIKVKWLLNYRGGSFLIPYDKNIKEECQIRGVDFELISDDEAFQILKEISSPSKKYGSSNLRKSSENSSLFTQRQHALGRCRNLGFNLWPKSLMDVGYNGRRKVLETTKPSLGNYGTWGCTWHHGRILPGPLLARILRAFR